MIWEKKILCRNGHWNYKKIQFVIPFFNETKRKFGLFFPHLQFNQQKKCCCWKITKIMIQFRCEIRKLDFQFCFHVFPLCVCSTYWWFDFDFDFKQQILIFLIFSFCCLKKNLNCFFVGWLKLDYHYFCCCFFLNDGWLLYIELWNPFFWTKKCYLFFCNFSGCCCCFRYVRRFAAAWYDMDMDMDIGLWWW